MNIPIEAKQQLLKEFNLDEQTFNELKQKYTIIEDPFVNIAKIDHDINLLNQQIKHLQHKAKLTQIGISLFAIDKLIYKLTKKHLIDVSNFQSDFDDNNISNCFTFEYKNETYTAMMDVVDSDYELNLDFIQEDIIRTLLIENLRKMMDTCVAVSQFWYAHPSSARLQKYNVDNKNIELRTLNCNYEKNTFYYTGNSEYMIGIVLKKRNESINIDKSDNELDNKSDNELDNKSDNESDNNNDVISDNEEVIMDGSSDDFDELA